MPDSPFFADDDSMADAGTAEELLRKKTPGNPFFNMSAPIVPNPAPGPGAPPDMGQPAPMNLPWMPKPPPPQRPPLTSPTGQIQPGATKGQRLMILMQSGLQGAMAGEASSAQALAASGGRRGGNFGSGFMAATEQRLEQPERQQAFQRGAIQNTQAQQQTQLTGQQIAQTQALNQAYVAGTVKDPQTGAVTFDRDKVTKALAASGQGALIPSLTKSFTEMDKAAGDILKQKDEHAAAADDYVGAALQAITATKDPKTGAYSLAATGGVLAHLAQVYPQEADQLRAAIAANPSRLNAIVDGAIAQSPAQAKIASEKTTADARARQAGTGAQSLADKTDPNSPLYDPSAVYIAKRAAAGDPDAVAIQAQQTKQAGAVAGAQAEARQPYQKQLEQVRQQVQQTFQNNKNAQDKIETSVLKPYQDKMSQIGELQSALAQAQAGNVAAARATLYKVIGIAQPQGTHRVAPTEVTGFSGMGSIGQRMAGSIANALSGDPWTPQMVQDIKAFGDAQGQVAQDNLNRGIGNVNKLYQTNVGQGLMNGGGGQGGQVQVTDPKGGVHTFPDQASADNFKKLARIP